MKLHVLQRGGPAPLNPQLIVSNYICKQILACLSQSAELTELAVLGSDVNCMTVAVFGTNVLRRQLWVTLPFGASSPGSRHSPLRAGRKVQNRWHFCRLIFVKCRTVATIGMKGFQKECRAWAGAQKNAIALLPQSCACAGRKVRHCSGAFDIWFS